MTFYRYKGGFLKHGQETCTLCNTKKQLCNKANERKRRYRKGHASLYPSKNLITAFKIKLLLFKHASKIALLSLFMYFPPSTLYFINFPKIICTIMLTLHFYVGQVSGLLFSIIPRISYHPISVRNLS